MRPYPYAGLYLASLTVFECCSADLYKGTPGGRGSGKDDCSTHLQLMSSRSSDLTEWQRPGDREPIIDRGDPGEWDAGFISASDYPVVVGDELWMYYGGFGYTQQHQSCQVAVGGIMKPGDVPTGIGVAKMRLDGFASLNAGREPGKLVTRPLQFSGSRLEVNAVVRGSLRVAVLDEEGHALQGLGEVECAPLQGGLGAPRCQLAGRPRPPQPGREAGTPGVPPAGRAALRFPVCEIRQEFARSGCAVPTSRDCREFEGHPQTIPLLG